MPRTGFIEVRRSRCRANDDVARMSGRDHRRQGQKRANDQRKGENLLHAFPCFPVKHGPLHSLELLPTILIACRTAAVTAVTGFTIGMNTPRLMGAAAASIPTQSRLAESILRWLLFGSSRTTIISGRTRDR